MRSSLTVNLITYEILPGSFSDEGEKRAVKRKVYGNAYGTGLDTVLRAQREGLRISGQVEVYTFEYQGEEDIEVGGKRYQILNASTRGDKTVLSYGEVIGNGH